MDANELKIQNPELYAAIFDAGKAEGVAAGRTEGATAERERILKIQGLGSYGAAGIIAAAVKDPTKTAETIALEILGKQGTTAAAAMAAHANDAQTLGKQADQVATGAIPQGAADVSKSLAENVKKARR